ncbi:unnamed protein product (macronuclear) [Paramecium tetraurelia]|uniref:Uncharacterized protein n=1 Tax=Paramecium tetraurelia TaxID=5888 RepID=A0DRH2_PARTE|nr:uncharacterized protein GSPATT00019356001 [Paramecium tetraurelia]CAK85639.1 unnamed protein product [Paramecium tetraurelia]|eukprot:XP_001453036.1 hypothetical protein (macronuclear) [Paramecium tetraurelia strain d4-2]
MTNSRVHAIDSLKPQSLIHMESQEQIQDNQIVICKTNPNIKSILKKQEGQQKEKKQLQFKDDRNKIYVVENWKIYNTPFDEDDSCCCLIQ